MGAAGGTPVTWLWPHVLAVLGGCLEPRSWRVGAEVKVRYYSRCSRRCLTLYVMDRGFVSILTTPQVLRKGGDKAKSETAVT